VFVHRTLFVPRKPRNFADSLRDLIVNVLFWLSIGLWVVALASYAMLLSSNEQLQREDARMSVFVPFEALFQSAGYSRSRRFFYRTLVLSAIGAMVSGGLYLLTWA
jgi:uncharacterized membrane protein YbhN (UPF0104 family)